MVYAHLRRMGTLSIYQSRARLWSSGDSDLLRQPLPNFFSWFRATIVWARNQKMITGSVLRERLLKVEQLRRGWWEPALYVDDLPGSRYRWLLWEQRERQLPENYIFSWETNYVKHKWMDKFWNKKGIPLPEFPLCHYVFADSITDNCIAKLERFFPFCQIIPYKSCFSESLLYDFLWMPAVD